MHSKMVSFKELPHSQDERAAAVSYFRQQVAAVGCVFVITLSRALIKKKPKAGVRYNRAHLWWMILKKPIK